MWNRALVALSVLAACAGGGESHEGSAVVAERRAEVAEEPEPRGLLVRVIDDETGRPVPGARVMYCDAECMPWGFPKFELLVAMHDLRDLARKIGITTTTNEAGETRVPWSFPQACVMTEAGELWGLGPREWNALLPTEPVLLPISRGTPVKVRVQDVDGQPVAGVPVELLLRCTRQRSVIARTVSGQDGRAEFPHADRLVDLHQAMHWAHFDEGGTVEADVMSVSYSMLGLDPRPVEDTIPPVDVVPLVVPRCGSVTADVLALQREDAGPVHVVLRDDMPDEWDERSPELPVPGMRHMVADASGMVRFDHVPITRAMKLLAWREGAAAVAEQRIAALTRPRENVHVVFASDPIDARIHGTVQEAGGQPVADAEFWLTDVLARAQWQNGHRVLVRTDRAGRWSANVLGNFKVRARQFELDRRGWTEFERTEFHVERMIEFGADVDTGPVRLAPKALLASGTVTSSTGAPLRDVLVGWKPDEGWWDPYMVWTDAHGRFELWTEASDEAAPETGPSSEPRKKRRLHARGRGYGAFESAPIAVGARDRTLALHTRTESLTLRFRVRDALDVAPLRFELANEQDHANGPSVQARIDRTPEPTRFIVTWLGVEPGDHDVLVKWRSGALHAPILVRVWPHDVEPVRELDLTPFLRRIEVRATDRRGEPVRRVMLNCGGAEDSFWQWRLHAQDGRYELSIPQAATWLRLESMDGGSWSTERIASRIEARLDTALLARVSLTNAPELPAGFRYLVDDTDYSGWPDLMLGHLLRAGACRPPAAAEFAYSEAGDQELIVYLDPPPGWPKRPIPVAQQSVTLSETGGDEITIRIDPARVAEVLEQWRAWR